MNSVLWGCCWFNESVDIINKFLEQSINAFKAKKIEAHLIVFIANTQIRVEEIKKVKEKFDKVIFLKNEIEIYPNKNYGVYSIIDFAHYTKIKNVAIVDPDWSIKECQTFIDSILTPTIKGEADLVIPNILNAAGRSNKIVGSTIVELFYPDYKEIIKTPFPGSFSAVTEKIYPIINSNNYHFDWGGEWDIIASAINKNIKIKTVEVNVENIRHRNNKSKMNDSHQIWRAVFSNKDIISRFENIKQVKCDSPNDSKIEKILQKNDISIESIIKKLLSMDLDETEKQLLYMTIYPLYSLINNKIYNYSEIDESIMPYSKEKIDYIKEISILFAKKILINNNISIKKIHENACEISGGYFGIWNKKNIKKAKEEIHKQIQELL